MRVLTSKSDGLSSYFDILTESNFNDTLLKETLNDNHTTRAKEGKVIRTRPLGRFFGFRKSFKKIAKDVGFYPTFRTVDLQKKCAYTKILAAKIFIVHINPPYLFVPMLKPSPETQSNFNNPIQKSFTVSIDS